MLAVLDPVRYAAANASVRARMAQLLPAHVWQAMLAASDLGELVGLLSQTHYRTILESVIEPTPDSERVELELWTYLARSHRSLLKLLQGSPRTLLEWLWRRFEVDNLKTILRTVHAGVPPAEIRAALIPLEAISDLTWGDLTGATSVSEVVERLRSTYYGAFYARALQQALDRYRRERETFGLEVTLDLAYYRRLLQAVDKLSGRDRREAERLIGTMIDGQNLLWAFRYRVYFELTPEEILNYTLQRGLRVDAVVVRQIATGASIEESVRNVWGTDLADLDRLAEMPPEEALPDLELSFRRYLHQLALSARQGYPFHLGPILAYELLLENEVRDLMTIIEGKTAGWSSEWIEPDLIGQRGS